MVTSALGIGGAETHIITLAQALIDRGHTVEIVSAGGPLAEKMKIPHHSLPLNRKGLPSVLCCLRGLRKLFRWGKYDIVHAHARFPALLCKLCGASPLVTTAHWVFTAKFPQKQLSFWGEATLAVSEDIRDYLLQHYKNRTGHILITVNGINTERFSPVSGPLSYDIVHVSRFDPGRSLCAKTLLSVFKELAPKIPQARLWLVGDGVLLPELREKAQEVNRALGAERILLPGGTCRPEIYLQHRPIFVGVSRAALEAMACGCVVLLFGDEGSLSLFQPEDPQLAEKSNFCCRGGYSPTKERLSEDLALAFRLSQDERRALGDANRQYVQSRYSPAVMAQDALAIYRQVKRTVLCGYYGKGNLGDELTLSQFRKKLGGKILPIAHSPNSNSGVRQGGILSALRLFRPGTTFILGGGTLLQNQTSDRSLWYYTTLFRLAARRGCFCALESAGIGEIRGTWATHAVKQTLLLADRIALRTERDMEIAAALCPERRDIHLSHDIVLELTPPETAMPPEESYALLSLRAPSSLEKNALAFLPSILEELCKKGLTIYLIPMHPQEDLAFCLDLSKEFPELGVRLKMASQEELPRIVQNARLCVTMRFHLAILALALGVPCYYLPYDEKLAALEEDLNHLWQGRNPALERLTKQNLSDIHVGSEEGKRAILSLAEKMRRR